MSNWLLWQINCRTRKSPIEVPFIGKTKLSVSRGMHGATGNIYCGLHEFNDMAFVLHFLRPPDLFVDIGANVGTYTILSSGVCGATSIAIEPVAATASSLRDNVEINQLAERVSIEITALGELSGEVDISNFLDCTNHVLRPGEAGDFETVSQKTLDNLLGGRPANLIKIDVEGFEMQVLHGAERTLADEGLKAVIMEINGSGRHYGISDDELHSELENFGFYPYFYRPMDRNLHPVAGSTEKGGNQIFLRDLEMVKSRLKQGKSFRVLGQSI